MNQLYGSKASRRTNPSRHHCTVASAKSTKLQFLVLLLRFVRLVCLGGILLCSQTLIADDPKPLFSKATDSVWYSVEDEAIVPANPESRESINTTDRPALYAEATSSEYAPSVFSSLSDFFRAFFQLLAYAWVSILATIVLVVVGILVFFLLRIQKYSMGGPATAPRKRVTLDEQNRKVTDLPFELEQTQIGLLEAAAKYRSQGDYSKAIIYLFSHVLIELDAVGYIRLERGKTNWTYLKELRRRDWERAFTSPIVQWFEHVFFGKNDMDAAAFETIWALLPGFESRLRIEEGKS